MLVGGLPNSRLKALTKSRPPIPMSSEDRRQVLINALTGNIRTIPMSIRFSSMIVSRTPTVSNFSTFICVVVAVFAAGWMMLRLAKSVDRYAVDSRYRRRRSLLLATIYIFSMVLGIGEVIRGNHPAWSLLFLPIPLWFIYHALRTAKQARNPRH